MLALRGPGAGTAGVGVAVAGVVVADFSTAAGASFSCPKRLN